MKKLFSLLLVAALAWGGYRLWFSHGLKPVDAGSEKRVTLKIEKGMPLPALITALHEKGLIRQQYVFRSYLLGHKMDTGIKAGTYVLSPSMSVQEIAQSLVDGQSNEQKVTIPEGLTLKQIDALMAERGFGQSGDIIRCAYTCDFASFTFLPQDNMYEQPDAVGTRLEGYLYPDTYFVERDNYVPKFFIERMLGTFRARVLTPHAAAIKESERDLHAIITMASLVEKETRRDDERATVAGILWKRLDAEMGLDVDATVRYVTGNMTGALTRTELDIDSPYNTRRYRGLPPGPIANPGLQAIEAALSPQESPYWYYLHGKDGLIRYAKTNDEHNLNKAKYLK